MAFLLKVIRSFKIPKFRRLVPYLVYLIFIAFVLSISFPSKDKHEEAEKRIILESGDSADEQESFVNIEENVVQQLTDAFNRY
jgi:hypothetical protein